MQLKKAIELAFKEGGYYFGDEYQGFYGDVVVITDENGVPTKLNVYQILMDPQFWQCLGKAIGLDNNTCFACGSQLTPSKHCPCCGEYRLSLYRWHRMIDHLAQGGTIESYFEQL